jgi:hypothetical protein
MKHLVADLEILKAAISKTAGACMTKDVASAG